MPRRANSFQTKKVVVEFNTGLERTPLRFLLVFHRVNLGIQMTTEELYQLMLWKNIWKRNKWEELQHLTNLLTRRTISVALVATPMKISNLFLKVKVINFHLWEVEKPNQVLKLWQLLLITTKLVECPILLKNMLKKKINLQWQSKESIILRAKMTPSQLLLRNGLSREILKTQNYSFKSKDTKSQT